MTWTLLIDVDEYITFNQIQVDDPAVPLDVAPEDILTLSDWEPVYNLVKSEVRIYHLFTALRSPPCHIPIAHDIVTTTILTYWQRCVY